MAATVAEITERDAPTSALDATVEDVIGNTPLVRIVDLETGEDVQVRVNLARGVYAAV